MPSAPKPKEFVAARNFRYAGRTYHVGDPVTERRIVGELIERWGSKYLTSRKPAPAEPSAEDSATQPPTAESPEED